MKRRAKKSGVHGLYILGLGFRRGLMKPTPSLRLDKRFKLIRNMKINPFLNGPIRPLFRLFSFFSHANTINDNSIDGVLGTRARAGVGADDSTELLRQPQDNKSFRPTAIIN